MDMTGLMEKAIAGRASDLHLQEGRPPMMRVATGLSPASKEPLDRSSMHRALEAVGWSGEHDGDGAFSWKSSLRCRLHVCREQAGLHLAIRFLYPIEDLPEDRDQLFLTRLGTLSSGLVLVSGPTGSGKTTALWRILHGINERRRCHIVTLEDPIEYVEAGKEALITQRELGRHFPSFAEGIRQSLRQDPDVILIGEMRDRETMDAALTAAETGHLVFSTLHTPSAVHTVSRIASTYGADGQDEVRHRLSMVLQAVLSQRLVVCGEVLAVAREILVRTPAVSQLIRSGKEHQLPTVMQTGSALGMRTMDQALVRLAKGG